MIAPELADVEILKTCPRPLDAGSEAVASLLLAETLRDPGAVEVGHQRGMRWTIGLAARPAPEPRPGRAHGRRAGGGRKARIMVAERDATGGLDPAAVTATGVMVGRVLGMAADDPRYAVARPAGDDGSVEAWVVDANGNVSLTLSGYRTVELPGGADPERLAPLQAALAEG